MKGLASTSLQDLFPSPIHVATQIAEKRKKASRLCGVKRSSHRFQTRVAAID
jgi:hypothetical protein